MPRAGLDQVQRQVLADPGLGQALDSILGMAVQLPALKTLGEELGLSMGGTMNMLKKDTETAP